MKNKFHDKYRIPSARLKDWDYGSNAAYFITICTQNRECWFGKVIDGQINLSVTGHLAYQYWHEIPTHFPYVILGEFVVMPNHIHGILIVNKTDETNKTDNDRDAINRVSTVEKTVGGITGKNNPMLHDNISRIVRWYKGRVSFECRKINAGFAWQSRFYDHIIRDDASFYYITEYIHNNPLNWHENDFHDETEINDIKQTI